MIATLRLLMLMLLPALCWANSLSLSIGLHAGIPSPPPTASNTGSNWPIARSIAPRQKAVIALSAIRTTPATTLESKSPVLPANQAHNKKGPLPEKQPLVPQLRQENGVP
ncbi:hypothetical protein QDX81_01665 [Pseudomonas sp. CW003PS]|nr:hypothetical protein QDX81_01665 [Pseudomonas sp. CW003PS]